MLTIDHALSVRNAVGQEIEIDVFASRRLL